MPECLKAIDAHPSLVLPKNALPSLNCNTYNAHGLLKTSHSCNSLMILCGKQSRIYAVSLLMLLMRGCMRSLYPLWAGLTVFPFKQANTCSGTLHAHAPSHKQTSKRHQYLLPLKLQLFLGLPLAH